MEIKVFIVLTAVLSSSLGQSINCRYGFLQSQYTCFLTIQNPNGFDNFTEIQGSHLLEMNDALVTIIYGISGVTKNIPGILCSQFLNISYIDLSYFQIQDVDENSFVDCKNLEYLGLEYNRITQLPDNLFIHNSHLQHLNLERNLLTTLPEELLINQLELLSLNLDENPITILPNGVFKNLRNLKLLRMYKTALSSIHPAWFESLYNLEYLDLTSNPLNQTIPADAFKNLVQLDTLFLDFCSIRSLNAAWFRNMRSLYYISMQDNEIESVPANLFANSTDLGLLDLGGNKIREISQNAFDNLPNLIAFALYYNRVQTLHPRWFEEKTKLEELYLESNEIVSLPIGVFKDLSSVNILNLESNNIRTISRNSFGSYDQLRTLYVSGNVIDSIDERFLRGGPGLNFVYFGRNVCTDSAFFNFANRIEENVRRLSNCTRNFRFGVERTTEAGGEYTFLSSRNPGMHVEVHSDQEISIALTPINFVWTPMLEIVLNRDMIKIIRNRATEVAVIPNEGIFIPGAGNRYRIVWSSQAIMMFKASNEIPFLDYTMRDVFPPSFLGLRSQHSRASWFLEPIQKPRNSRKPRFMEILRLPTDIKRNVWRFVKTTF